ncbi:MAG: hypothetical protein LW837_01515 [Roseomonas sp.]|nr:hypothetical protein [Roseomonas sp.]
MNDTLSTDQLFLEIAKRHMPSVETLETRNRDALDFHDVVVWSIHNPLAEANVAGQRFVNCHIDGSFHSIYLKSRTRFTDRAKTQQFLLSAN